MTIRSRRAQQRLDVTLHDDPEQAAGWLDQPEPGRERARGGLNGEVGSTEALTAGLILAATITLALGWWQDNGWLVAVSTALTGLATTVITGWPKVGAWAACLFCIASGFYLGVLALVGLGLAGSGILLLLRHVATWSPEVRARLHAEWSDDLSVPELVRFGLVVSGLMALVPAFVLDDRTWYGASVICLVLTLASLARKTHLGVLLLGGISLGAAWLDVAPAAIWLSGACTLAVATSLGGWYARHLRASWQSQGRSVTRGELAGLALWLGLALGLTYAFGLAVLAEVLVGVLVSVLVKRHLDQRRQLLDEEEAVLDAQPEDWRDALHQASRPSHLRVAPGDPSKVAAVRPVMRTSHKVVAGGLEVRPEASSPASGNTRTRTAASSSSRGETSSSPRSEVSSSPSISARANAAPTRTTPGRAQASAGASMRAGEGPKGELASTTGRPGSGSSDPVLERLRRASASLSPDSLAETDSARKRTTESAQRPPVRPSPPPPRNPSRRP